MRNKIYEIGRTILLASMTQTSMYLLNSAISLCTLATLAPTDALFISVTKVLGL